MYIKTNLGGASRKALISTMEQLLNQKATYCGAPSFGYKFDCGVVDREGTLHLVASLQGPTVHNFARVLEQHGFSCTVGEDDHPVSFEIETPVSEASTEKFCIHIKRSEFEAPALERFTKLIESKSTLLKKALQVGGLPIHVDDERISLPWFDAKSNESERKAYQQLVNQLVNMAQNSRRITAKDKGSDNEKYTFRCFLLRLGFIGEEFKDARKILLRNLEGNSAFLRGAPKHGNPTTPAEQEVAASA